MGSLFGNHDDVSGAGFEFLILNRESRSPAANDPGLRIRVPVETRTVAPLVVVDEKERHSRAIGFALEGHCSSWAPHQFSRSNDRVSWCFFHVILLFAPVRASTEILRTNRPLLRRKLIDAVPVTSTIMSTTGKAVAGSGV
jgi:hypothetical protein